MRSTDEVVSQRVRHNVARLTEYGLHNPIGHDDSYDTLLRFRESSAVKRYHILRQIRTQTVGEHSHGVATLVMLVEPNCSANLLKAALCHDFHERATGDVPSTAKWMFPLLGEAVETAADTWNKVYGCDFELSEHETRVLKFCDYFELLMWSYEEYCMGNRYAREPIVKISKCIEGTDVYMCTPIARDLFDCIVGTVSELLP